MATTEESVSSLPPVRDGALGAPNTGSQTSRRTDAVGVEIPVVVHASRYSATARGVGKALPPVHEETRTVIVFPQGAVVRLSATVTAGERVVLTNQQSGADVLCRVVNVKAQPGIQNYVDLDFTQRAPGFWGDCFASERPVRTESPLPTLAPPIVATGAAVPTPVPPEQAVSLPVAVAESVSSTAAVTQAPAPTPAPATAPIPLAVPNSLASSPKRAAGISPSSNSIVGMSSGPRLAQSGQTRPSTPTSGPLFGEDQRSSSSKKPLWAVAAAVVVVGLTAGGFMLSRRGQSAPPAAPMESASPSVAAQPALSTQPNPALTSADAEATPAISTAEIQPEISAPQPTPAKSGSAVQPAPRRSGISVGKLKAPVRKNAVTAASSEPPPVLTPQGNGLAENMLGGLLANAGRPSAPLPPASLPAANSPVHPGGELGAPKLISSPAPLYPTMARVQNIQGVVVVDALVDATGKVTETKALSGPVPLRQAAMDAVRNWKYQPARLNGQPIAIHTNVNINFTLD